MSKKRNTQYAEQKVIEKIIKSVAAKHMNEIGGFVEDVSTDTIAEKAAKRICVYFKKRIKKDLGRALADRKASQEYRDFLS